MNNLENMGKSLPSKAAFLSISFVAMARALSDSSARTKKQFPDTSRTQTKIAATPQNESEDVEFLNRIIDYSMPQQK